MHHSNHGTLLWTPSRLAAHLPTGEIADQLPCALYSEQDDAALLFQVFPTRPRNVCDRPGASSPKIGCY
ncbi:MAG TPA: hypothetical protein VFT66_22465 [Roseiflexaceae bacterium]|nr:hypothetical protein [Roseiflexaceae bacterium]